MQDYSYKKKFCSKTFEKSKNLKIQVYCLIHFFKLALVLEEKKDM